MAKKVAMFKKLKQGMLEEIIVKACDFLINDCDTCPKFISSRCKESCNEMRQRRLRTEAKIMTDLEKLKQGMFDDMNDEANTPDDAPSGAPKGWIKLKMEGIGNDVYINTSTIVGLSTRSGMPGAFTEIYTIGAEDNPWLVEESIDKVMEKIKKS